MKHTTAHVWGIDWLDDADEDPNPEYSASAYFGVLTPVEEAALALELESNAQEIAA